MFKGKKMKHNQLKTLCLVLASAVSLSACNSGGNVDSGLGAPSTVAKSSIELGVSGSSLGKAVQNSKNFREAKLKNPNLTLTKIDLDLSQSNLLVTGESYKYVIFDRNNKSNPWLIPSSGQDSLTCKSRSSCIFTLDQKNIMSELNKAADKNNGEYDFYLVLLDTDNHLVSAGIVNIDPFSGASLAVVNSDLIGISDLAYDIVLQEYFLRYPNQNLADFSSFMNSLFPDSVITNFKNSAGENSGFIGKSTIGYFYMSYMLNKQKPATPQAAVNAIMSQAKNMISDKKIDNGFVSDPKVAMKDLLDTISKMLKLNADAGFARSAKDINGYLKTVSEVSNVLKGLPIPHFSGVFGTTKDIANTVTDALSFLSEQTGSAAALQEYEKMRNQVTGFIVPPYTLMDGVDAIRKSIMNMNNYIMGSKQIEIIQDFSNEVHNVQYALGGLSIEKFVEAHTYDWSWYTWVDKVDFKKLSLNIALISNPELLENVAYQMRDKIGLNSSKGTENRIALARAYNYELQKLMFTQIAQNNRFAYLEKIIAYGALSGKAGFTVAGKFQNIAIPDVPNSSYTYEEAIKQIDAKTTDRNSRIFKIYSQQAASEADYVPPSARHLVSSNSCDFTYSDMYTGLKASCKYFVPKDVSPSGVIMIPSAIRADECDKTDGQFMKIKKVDNYLGKLSCFDPRKAEAYGKPLYNASYLTMTLISEKYRPLIDEGFWKDGFNFYSGLDRYNLSEGGTPEKSYGYKLHGRISTLSDFGGSSQHRFSVQGEGKDGKQTGWNDNLKLNQVVQTYYNERPNYWWNSASISPFEIKDSLGNKLGLFNAYINYEENTKGGGPTVSAGVLPIMGDCTYSDREINCPVQVKDTPKYVLNIDPQPRLTSDDKSIFLLDFLIGYRDIPFTNVKSKIDAYLKTSAFQSCSRDKRLLATSIGSVAADCKDAKKSDNNYWNQIRYSKSGGDISSCENNNGQLTCY